MNLLTERRALGCALVFLTSCFSASAQEQIEPLGFTKNFPAGLHPYGVACEADHVWITNNGDNTVTEYRASDSTLIATIPVGDGPREIISDGASVTDEANLWITNFGDGTVTKIRGSDGAVVGTFNAGPNPNGIAVFGGSIYVGNYGAGTITKLRQGNGAMVATFTVPQNPTALLVAVGKLWVAAEGDNTVSALALTDGRLFHTSPVGDDPEGLAYDGKRIWVANYSSNNLTTLKPKDGSFIGTTAAGEGPFHIFTSLFSHYILVTNNVSSDAWKIRVTDHKNTFRTDRQPLGLAEDEDNQLWIANYGSHNVSRVHVGVPSGQQ